MGLLIGGLVVILLIALLIGSTLGLFGLLITLLIAAIVGWLADLIVPGRLPFGWLGAIAAGLLGSWLGSTLFGNIGPVVGGIPIISALIGAIILAFVLRLLFGGMSRAERY